MTSSPGPHTPAGVHRERRLPTAAELSQLAVVGRFVHVSDAQMACGNLEAHSIQAFIDGDGLVGVASFLSNAIGGVKVLVSVDDESTAKMLLEAPAAAELPDEDPQVLPSEAD